MDQVFYQSKTFFNLPLNQKMKVLRNDNSRGYTPLLDEILDPKNQLHGDFKEGFYIGVEDTDSLDHKPFHGPNLWPASGNN